MATDKNKQQFSRITPFFLVGVFVASLFGLLSQTHRYLLIHPVNAARSSAIAIAASPRPLPAAVPTVSAKPSDSPEASTSPKPATIAPAHQTSVVPVVTPAPHSNVSHLVAVAPVAPSQPAPSPSPSPSSSPGLGSSPTPSPSPTPPSQPPSYTYTSTNWSGYLATDGIFSGISGTWTVPQVSGNGVSTSGDAAWIGIGGVTSADLIQVGTEDTVSAAGRVQVNGFYELLPAVSTPISAMQVNGGDTMSASLSKISHNQWQITITDETDRQTFQTVVFYNSSESSAEWIEEDPSYASGQQVPFDQFGAVAFSGAETTDDGTEKTLSTTDAQSIALVNSQFQLIAVPSGETSDGEGFTVTSE